MLTCCRTANTGALLCYSSILSQMLLQCLPCNVWSLLYYRESEQGAGRDAGSGGSWGDGPEHTQWASGLLIGGEGHAAGEAGGCREETGKSEPHWQLDGGTPPGKEPTCNAKDHIEPHSNVLTVNIVCTVVRVNFYHVRCKFKVSVNEHSPSHFEKS